MKCRNMIIKSTSRNSTELETPHNVYLIEVRFISVGLALSLSQNLGTDFFDAFQLRELVCNTL